MARVLVLLAFAAAGSHRCPQAARRVLRVVAREAGHREQDARSPEDLEGAALHAAKWGWMSI